MEEERIRQEEEFAHAEAERLRIQEEVFRQIEEERQRYEHEQHMRQI